MNALITKDTPVSQEVLNTIAHLPTKSLPKIVEAEFVKNLTDADFMRIGVLLAKKGYDEGGCPIGGVIISNETRQILGKGHNTLVQENHPYNHGETSAARDAGRLDFSLTTMFTTLSPGDICAALIYRRQFKRLIVGHTIGSPDTLDMLRQKGVEVEILRDSEGIALFEKYRQEKPDQHMEDAFGLAAVHQAAAGTI
jgi:creatinine deaminase